MIKLDKKGFKQNLIEALDTYSCCIGEEDIDELIELNFDEDSDFTTWSYRDFTNLALDIIDRGFWVACDYNGLAIPIDEDDRIEMPWEKY